MEETLYMGDVEFTSMLQYLKIWFQRNYLQLMDLGKVSCYDWLAIWIFRYPKVELVKGGLNRISIPKSTSNINPFTPS